MPTIRPGSHVAVSFSVPFLDSVGERGEVSVNRLKVTVSEFVPLGFQRPLELYPKVSKLFWCHRGLPIWLLAKTSTLV
jgi:hypothetical protein